VIQNCRAPFLNLTHNYRSTRWSKSEATTFEGSRLHLAQTVSGIKAETQRSR